jgi:hypothetical protein
VVVAAVAVEAPPAEARAPVFQLRPARAAVRVRRLRFREPKPNPGLRAG